MKAKRFSRTRSAVKTGALALFVAALAFAATSQVLTHSHRNSGSELGDVVLTATQNFGITTTISDSSSVQNPASLLPGAPRYLWYTVHNPLLVPITVNALSIITPVANVGGCGASNLDISGTTFSGSLVVPAKVGATQGTASVARPISLKNLSASQDACKGVTFTFNYAGTATYIEVYNTSTAVASSLNPSVVGQSVTYTANVTGIVGSGQDPLPNGPTGTVTFKDGATTICSNVAVTVGATTSTASCTPAPAYSSPISHAITATYTNSDGNFTGSNGALTQVVNLPTGCSGSYNSIVGNPSSPTINGTNGNDFVYAVGANYTINGGQGNDCIVVGDGANSITAGNGTNVIVAGNGKNTITAGNGTNRITVGNGSNSTITAGNGANTIVLGTGANNSVTLGNGANTITIQTAGNHNTITVGNGTNDVFLGGGTFNKFTGGKSGNTCHLPSLPASTYNDTLVNCTAVTP